MSSEENIRKLFAKKEMHEIDGVQVQFQQLSIDDLELMDIREEDSPSVRKEKMQLLISKSTGWPMDVVKQISVEYFMDIQQIVMRLNGITDDKLEKIKAMQERVKRGGRG